MTANWDADGCSAPAPPSPARRKTSTCIWTRSMTDPHGR
jgi:hypothetical protein